jgi:hypothetical protein
MKKRKFAAGGSTDLTMIDPRIMEPFPFPMPFPSPGGSTAPSSSGGGTARDGLSTVREGAQVVGGALDDIQSRIGGGGGLGSMARSTGMTMKKGGAVKGYAKGGMVGSASKRADGCAQRGKTKGRII